MMKRNRERPLVESSKLLDRRPQNCATHSVTHRVSASNGCLNVKLEDYHKMQFYTFRCNSTERTQIRKSTTVDHDVLQPVILH